MLRHAVLLPEGVRSAQVPDRAPPPDVMAALHQTAAALSVYPAEQMRASVFQPSHILPTRTLAEQVRYLSIFAGPHGKCIVSEL